MPTAAVAAIAGLFGGAVGALVAVRARRLAGQHKISLPATVAASALGVALEVAVVIARHATVDRVLGVALVAVMIVASGIDIATRRIPNRLTGWAALLAVVLGAVLHPGGLPGQLAAGLVAGGLLLVFAIVHSRGLGMGDVKLAAVLGLYLGSSVAVALFAGMLVAAVGGLTVMARVGVAKGRMTKIPLGPFLSVGGVVALLCGPELVHWYVHTAIR